jgi:hypothetical protein
MDKILWRTYGALGPAPCMRGALRENAWRIGARHAFPTMAHLWRNHRSEAP